MPQHSGYRQGQWLMRCDQCARVFYSDQMRKRWDGAWVDDACWEPRHPQDFLRAVKDNPSVPVSRDRTVSIAQSLLAAPITAIATSLTVTTGDGSLFSTTFPFYASLQADAKVDELIKVTNIVGDTFTIVRNLSGFPSQAWATGSRVVTNSLNPTISL